MKKPNIVLIITDQERYDSLGVCGNKYADTPNIDSLGKNGLIFDRFITSSAICQPSRASLLTGLHSSTHGVWTNGICLPREEYTSVTEYAKTATRDNWVASHVNTLGDKLQEGGYKTAAVGKLHLSPYSAHKDMGSKESMSTYSEKPISDWNGPYCGFEHIEITTGHGEFIGGHYGEWLSKEHPDIVKLRNESKENRVLEFESLPSLYPSVIPEEVHNSTWIGDRASRYILDASEEKPFFLWVGFPDPHSPFVPPASLAKEFEGRDVLMPSTPSSVYPQKTSDMKDIMERRNYSKTAEKEIRRMRQYTDAMMKLIDINVGKIVDSLEKKGVLENTIIVFTSDHGDFLGDYGIHGKSTPCCKSLNHVPFILSGNIDESLKGTRTNEACSSVDVVTTLCNLASVEPPKLNHGEDMFGIIKNSRKSPVMVEHYIPQFERQNISVYDNNFRYTHYTHTGESELYEHQSDEHECVNLSNVPRFAKEKERLHEALLKEQYKTLTPLSGRITVW